MHKRRAPPKALPKKVVPNSSKTSTDGLPPNFNKEQYEKELKWCIEQLELGLKREGVTPEQAKESNAVIRKLKSNMSVVQKRHLMRVVFGDYRKWMAETKKMEEEMEKERLKKEKQREKKRLKKLKKKEALKQENENKSEIKEEQSINKTTEEQPTNEEANESKSETKEEQTINETKSE